jgi:hypothetical protein
VIAAAWITIGLALRRSWNRDRCAFPVELLGYFVVTVVLATYVMIRFDGQAGAARRYRQLGGLTAWSAFAILVSSCIGESTGCGD